MQPNTINERGSVMIEVLAILTLLGVMAPMLVRQISMRSQEVDNVNMASEIRTIAEGVDAYMQADRSTLEAKCAITDETAAQCDLDAIDKNQLCLFLPNGFCGADTSNNGILDDYTITLSGYLLDAEIAPRPVYQAIIIPSNSGSTAILPTGFNLKRAARIASMIGVTGGIVQKGNEGYKHAYGTNGAWAIDLESGYNTAMLELKSLFDNNSDIRATYLAVVTLSSFTPEVYTADATDPNRVAVPENMGFGDLHAWNYFSVGQASPALTNSCIERHSTTVNPDTGAVQSDIIRKPGTEGCDPLFWVGATGGGTDKSKTGHVYVKNNLYVGRNNTDDKQAIALENDKEAATSDASDNRLIVYDLMGTQRARLDGSGRLLLTDEEGKTLSVKATGIVSSETQSDIGDSYQIDFTSAGNTLLEDIRLGARKGTKLSELLPNYISKTVHSITTSGAVNPFIAKIEKPACPTGFKPALIVTPTRWDNANVEYINAAHTHTLSNTAVNNIANKLYVTIPAGNTASTQQVKANTGTVNLAGSTTVYNATNTIDGRITKDKIIHKNNRFAISIDEHVNDTAAKETTYPNTAVIPPHEPRSVANETGTWTVKLGYKNVGNNIGCETGVVCWDSAITSPVNYGISALAQTYCVYVP